MELYEQLFHDLEEFNDYLNIRLIEDHIRIVPITVIETSLGKLKIYYRKEELEI